MNKCPVPGCDKEVPSPTQLPAHLVYKHDMSPSQAKALLAGDQAVLSNKGDQGKVAELEEQLAQAQAKTMDDFNPIEKAKFVISWAREISPEDKAVFAQAVGIPMGAEAVMSESEEVPAVIYGKTDKPGYKYLEMMDLSVKE